MRSVERRKPSAFQYESLFSMCGSISLSKNRCLQYRSRAERSWLCVRREPLCELCFFFCKERTVWNFYVCVYQGLLHELRLTLQHLSSSSRSRRGSGCLLMITILSSTQIVANLPVKVSQFAQMGLKCGNQANHLSAMIIKERLSFARETIKSTVAAGEHSSVLNRVWQATQSLSTTSHFLTPRVVTLLSHLAVRNAKPREVSGQWLVRQTSRSTVH